MWTVWMKWQPVLWTCNQNVLCKRLFQFPALPFLQCFIEILGGSKSPKLLNKISRGLSPLSTQTLHQYLDVCCNFILWVFLANQHFAWRLHVFSAYYVVINLLVYVKSSALGHDSPASKKNSLMWCKFHWTLHAVFRFQIQPDSRATENINRHSISSSFR